MALIEVNWRPGRAQLRQFALISLAGFGLLGLVFAWRMGALSGSGRWTVALALWAAGALIGAMGLAHPPAALPAYVALMAVALPIGWVVTHVVMAVLYYGLFTPIGLFFRLIGRDPLHRRFDADAPSYWVPRPPSPRPARYFRQF